MKLTKQHLAALLDELVDAGQNEADMHEQLADERKHFAELGQQIDPKNLASLEVDIWLAEQRTEAIKSAILKLTE